MHNIEHPPRNTARGHEDDIHMLQNPFAKPSRSDIGDIITEEHVLIKNQKQGPPRQPRSLLKKGSDSPAERAYSEIYPQPDSRPITSEQLCIEVKNIYSRLVIVEAKCTNLGHTELVDDVEPASSDGYTKPHSRNEWQAMLTLHRTLLYEHHDFLSASQHPAVHDPVENVGLKYSMPARMWKHGIHSFLELLRRRRSIYIHHRLHFIYPAYQMMALLYETVDAFGATWIEHLGYLGRHRVAIEDDFKRGRETLGSVARSWYRTAVESWLSATANRKSRDVSIHSWGSAAQTQLIGPGLCTAAFWLSYMICRDGGRPTLSALSPMAASITLSLIPWLALFVTFARLIETSNPDLITKWLRRITDTSNARLVIIMTCLIPMVSAFPGPGATTAATSSRSTGPLSIAFAITTAFIWRISSKTLSRGSATTSPRAETVSNRSLSSIQAYYHGMRSALSDCASRWDSALSVCLREATLYLRSLLVPATFLSYAFFVLAVNRSDVPLWASLVAVTAWFALTAMMYKSKSRRFGRNQQVVFAFLVVFFASGFAVIGSLLLPDHRLLCVPVCLDLAIWIIPMVAQLLSPQDAYHLPLTAYKGCSHDLAACYFLNWAQSFTCFRGSFFRRTFA